jgi:transcriptional regulator with XRE-family HTH domain
MTDVLVSEYQSYDEEHAADAAGWTAVVGAAASLPPNLGGALRYGRLAAVAGATGLDNCGAEFILRMFGGWTSAPFTAPSSAHRGVDATQALALLRASRGGLTLVARRQSEPLTPQEMVRWLYAESGLTWDQLSRILGVSRRSVHAWANGQRVSGANLERLSQVHVSIKRIDADSPIARRHTLFSPQDNMPNLFDRLVIHARKAEVPRDEHALLRRLGIAPED